MTHSLGVMLRPLLNMRGVGCTLFAGQLELRQLCSVYRVDIRTYACQLDLSCIYIHINTYLLYLYVCTYICMYICTGTGCLFSARSHDGPHGNRLASPRTRCPKGLRPYVRGQIGPTELAFL